MTKRFVFMLAGISILALFSLNCKRGNPITPPDNSFALAVDDASCTEVYLNLKIGAGITSRTVTLKRDTVTLFTKTIDAAETAITDTALLPNHTYSYTAQLPNSSLASSSTARTMDTTSHSWSFTTTMFGDGSGSSTLNDVAIINNTLAYAVGQIYRNDTTFNAAMWDGKAWHIQKLNYQGFPPVIKTIFAFNEQDIWFDPWFHWNGQSIQEIPIDPIFIGVGVNKMWGSSTGELFVVGNSGFIARRSTNGSWTKIESGTSLTLNDVWGGSNRWLGENVVLMPASEKYTSSEQKLLRIINGSVKDVLSWPQQDRRIHSVWFDQRSSVFTSGGGVFRSKSDGTWSEMYFYFPVIYTNRIRGNASNDVITVGDFGIVAHFNGVTWNVYNELAIAVGNYESVSIKNNLVVAVGFSNAQGIVVLGKRN